MAIRIPFLPVQSVTGLKRSFHYVWNQHGGRTFLACDSVSNEILLHIHYRCDERIIGFNNHKYYAGKLHVKSGRRLPEALEFIDVEHNSSLVKNAALTEAEIVTRYAS